MDFTIHAWQLTTSTSATIPIHSPQPICQACPEAGEERRRVSRLIDREPREGCRDQRPTQGAIPQSKLKETGGPNPIFNFQFLGFQGGAPQLKIKESGGPRFFKKTKQTILQPRFGEKSAESGREQPRMGGPSNLFKFHCHLMFPLGFHSKRQTYAPASLQIWVTVAVSKLLLIFSPFPSWHSQQTTAFKHPVHFSHFGLCSSCSKWQKQLHQYA